MKPPLHQSFSRAIVVAVTLLLLAQTFAQNTPIKLEVDATDAPRKVLHARLQIPAKPGKLTLVYPKWIPGEHGPTGPITDLVSLKFSASGKAIDWRRDAEDMFAFYLEVPTGADAVDVTLDFLLPPNSDGFSSGASSTDRLLDLSWNWLLLYPKGAKSSELQCEAKLRLPEGWKFGTALPLANVSAGGIEFAPVSLETLVDSPLIAGAHFRTVDLSRGAKPSHSLHIVADSAAALEIKPETTRQLSHLVSEANALFGALHYRDYHFLLTLSEHVAHFGLEHHQSSDNRQPERYLIDEEPLKLMALLLPHEMVHSWNGKYRRPTGLATSDYHEPMKGELLWVYEGLTDYYGIVLAARCGLWTNENFREWVALDAARLDLQKGRTWRPLADTTIAAQLLYEARPEGTAARRSVDFYPEGDLIWLEADVLIRQKTSGRKSLDDFCQRFFGGENSAPKVLPYTFDDVVSALNEIAPNDWRQFFQARVYAVNPRAPLGGVEGSGWRLIYKDTPSDMLKSAESQGKFTDMSFSLGFVVKESDAIADVIPGSPAEKAGIGPAMKLTAVNGRRWTPTLLREAVTAAKTASGEVELLVENADYFKACKIEYRAGEKYPHLERDDSKPDLLAKILKITHTCAARLSMKRSRHIRCWLIAALCAVVASRGGAADVTAIVTALMDEERALKGVPFAEIVRAATGKTVIPINLTNAVDRELVAKISRAMDTVMRSLNAADSAVGTKRRINEVSALFEAAMRTELNSIPGFTCDYPKTVSGAGQRSGYPDLRLLDKTSGRVVYLDPKLLEQGSRASSFRTFYFEPKKETNKILEDAHHLLVGFEHDGKADGTWRFLTWEIVDLSKFQVRLKAEFQGSNRDIYRREAVIGTSRTNSASLTPEIPRR